MLKLAKISLILLMIFGTSCGRKAPLKDPDGIDRPNFDEVIAK